MLGDLISPGDTKIDSTFADEGGYVRGGKEDEGDVMVLDQGNIEARFSPKLDIATGKKIESRLLQPTLCAPEMLAIEVLRRVPKGCGRCTNSWVQRREDGLLILLYSQFLVQSRYGG